MISLRPLNEEKNRLRSFRTWPGDAPIKPSRLAKAGFFSTGNGLEVCCFCCMGRISSWHEGDLVMRRHKLQFPGCAFVVDSANSGNVPIDMSSSASQAEETNVKSEAGRLATFKKWLYTCIVSPEELAKAGFYSLQDEDKVKCAFCDGVACNWVNGDVPMNEHRRLFPSCPFVKLSQCAEQPDAVVRVGGAASVDNNARIARQIDLLDLGLMSHVEAKHPEFVSKEARVRSFSGWPEDMRQTPEMLADAGFYYLGVADEVKCFHCDGGLRLWDPDDNPWLEHARWFPQCSFIKLVAGNGANRISDTSHRNRQPTEHEMQFLLSTEPALSALDIGLPLNLVLKALREKVAQTGTAFSTADALIEAALNIQHEDNSSSSDSESDKDCEASTSRGANQTSSGSRLEEENRQLKEARLCKICLDVEVAVVFLPCGHLATCVDCSTNLQKCPLCRCNIQASIRTFLT